MTKQKVHVLNGNEFQDMSADEYKSLLATGQQGAVEASKYVAYNTHHALISHCSEDIINEILRNLSHEEKLQLFTSESKNQSNTTIAIDEVVMARYLYSIGRYSLLAKLGIRQPQETEKPLPDSLDELLEKRVITGISIEEFRFRAAISPKGTQVTKDAKIVVENHSDDLQLKHKLLPTHTVTRVLITNLFGQKVVTQGTDKKLPSVSCNMRADGIQEAPIDAARRHAHDTLGYSKTIANNLPLVDDITAQEDEIEYHIALENIEGTNIKAGMAYIERPHMVVLYDSSLNKNVSKLGLSTTKTAELKGKLVSQEQQKTIANLSKLMGVYRSSRRQAAQAGGNTMAFIFNRGVVRNTIYNKISNFSFRTRREAPDPIDQHQLNQILLQVVNNDPFADIAAIDAWIVATLTALRQPTNTRSTLLDAIRNNHEINQNNPNIAAIIHRLEAKRGYKAAITPSYAYNSLKHFVHMDNPEGHYLRNDYVLGFHYPQAGDDITDEVVGKRKYTLWGAWNSLKSIRRRDNPNKPYFWTGYQLPQGQQDGAEDGQPPVVDEDFNLANEIAVLVAIQNQLDEIQAVGVTATDLQGWFGQMNPQAFAPNAVQQFGAAINQDLAVHHALNGGDPTEFVQQLNRMANLYINLHGTIAQAGGFNADHWINENIQALYEVDEGGVAAHYPEFVQIMNTMPNLGQRGAIINALNALIDLPGPVPLPAQGFVLANAIGQLIDAQGPDGIQNMNATAVELQGWFNQLYAAPLPQNAAQDFGQNINQALVNNHALNGGAPTPFVQRLHRMANLYTSLQNTALANPFVPINWINQNIQDLFEVDEGGVAALYPAFLQIMNTMPNIGRKNDIIHNLGQLNPPVQQPAVGYGLRVTYFGHAFANSWRWATRKIRKRRDYDPNAAYIYTNFRSIISGTPVVPQGAPENQNLAALRTFLGLAGNHEFDLIITNTVLNELTELGLVWDGVAAEATFNHAQGHSRFTVINKVRNYFNQPPLETTHPLIADARDELIVLLNPGVALEEEDEVVELRQPIDNVDGKLIAQLEGKGVYWDPDAGQFKDASINGAQLENLPAEATNMVAQPTSVLGQAAFGILPLSFINHRLG